MNKTDRQIEVLIREFGYRFQGGNLVSVGVRGFTSDRVVCRCRNLFDAAEQLRPMMGDSPEYARRHDAITNPK